MKGLVNNVMAKAFLKWAGGKSKSLELLQYHIYGELVEIKQRKVAGTFIEPFVGSGVVFMNVNADSYIINDINKDLVSIYGLLKTDGESFVAQVEEFFSGPVNTEEKYYIFRDEFNALDIDSDNRIKRAILFIYLNRYCFNGLCRYNKSGGFNVPYGKYKKIHFPKESLKTAIDKLENVVIFNTSFEEIMLLGKTNDVVYCDPPYVPLSPTASFTDYTKAGFTIEQQQQLAKLAEESKAKVLISNHDNEITRDLYKNADEIITKNIGRFISAKKESRKPVKELLAIYRKD